MDSVEAVAMVLPVEPEEGVVDSLFCVVGTDAGSAKRFFGPGGVDLTISDPALSEDDVEVDIKVVFVLIDYLKS